MKYELSKKVSLISRLIYFSIIFAVKSMKLARLDKCTNTVIAIFALVI